MGSGNAFIVHCVGSGNVWRRFSDAPIISREVRQLLLITESERDGFLKYGYVAH